MDLTDVPANARAGLLIMNGNSALAHVKPEDILETFEHGVSIQKQAAALGVTTQGIYRFLLNKAPDKWKEQQAAKALADLDASDQDLRDAGDGVAVSRARELARLHCWRLERAARHIYGDAPQVQVNINLGNVGERIAQLEQELGVHRTLEGEFSPTPSESA